MNPSTRQKASIVGLAIGSAALTTMAFGYLFRDQRPSVLSEKSRKIDYCVLGGGVIGASTAYHLGKSLRNNSVLLLDKGFVGSESSGLSAGTILDNGYWPNAPLHDRVHHTTTRIIKELEASKKDCEYVQSGSLKIATNDVEMQFLSELYELKKAGNVKLLRTQKEVAEVEPSLAGGTACGALYAPESGHVNPSMLTIELAAAAADSGVIVEEGRNVVNLLHHDKEDGYNYEIVLDNGNTISCKTLVLCAGVWSRPLGEKLGLSVPVTPVKGQIWTTEPVPGNVLNSVIFLAESCQKFANFDDFTPGGVPKDCTHTFENEQFIRHAYGRKCVDGRVIFGGSRIPCSSLKDHRAMYGVTEHDILINQKHVFEFAPTLKKYKIEGSWAGPMPFSQDGLPLVGECASFGMPDLWISTGNGPHGIMEGPGQGKLLAEAILRKKENFEVEDEELVDMMLDTFALTRKLGVKKL